MVDGVPVATPALSAGHQLADPLHVVAYRLDPEGVYTEYLRAAAGETVHLELPFPVSFDPAVLLRLKP